MAFWEKIIIFNSMKKFKYYSRGDKKKEQVGLVETKSIYMASILAAEMKKLTLTEFNHLFEVEEIKRK